MKTENFFRFEVIKSTVHGNNIRLKNSLNFSSYVSFVLFEALSLSSRSSQFAEGYFILIITCGGGISLFISHSSYELIMAISLSKYVYLIGIMIFEFLITPHNPVTWHTYNSPQIMFCFALFF